MHPQLSDSWDRRRIWSFDSLLANRGEEMIPPDTCLMIGMDGMGERTFFALLTFFTYTFSLIDLCDLVVCYVLRLCLCFSLCYWYGFFWTLYLWREKYLCGMDRCWLARIFRKMRRRGFFLSGGFVPWSPLLCQGSLATGRWWLSLDLHLLNSQPGARIQASSFKDDQFLPTFWIKQFAYELSMILNSHPRMYLKRQDELYPQIFVFIWCGVSSPSFEEFTACLVAYLLGSSSSAVHNSRWTIYNARWPTWHLLMLMLMLVFCSLESFSFLWCAYANCVVWCWGHVCRLPFEFSPLFWSSPHLSSESQVD